MKAIVVTLIAAALLTACERPPMKSTQQGYRGTGMQQVDNPRILAAQKAALPPLPELPPPAPSEGPKAKDVYQNVKVLGDLSVAEFTRHMLAMSQWVAPAEGCNYCHNPANLAEDSKYTKVVARRMIEMTRHVNADWGKHVGATGVTCYTCHRGNPVPANVYYTAATPKNNRVGPGMGNDAGQNKAEPSIALASLPYDPFTPYLAGGADGAQQIRVQGVEALPQDDHRTSIKQAEFTYSLMNHVSKSLGVNCTFCHNTQSFLTWNDKRVTAWYGIRMARDLNGEYLTPLTKTFPAHRLGPTGDVAKVNCATCHQGVNKPLGGLAMAKDYAGLIAVVAAAPAPAASASK
jgi:photosynthetic reaction center cytochrome c subunit